MSNYIGFSTINANEPRTTNPRVQGADMVKPLVFGKKFRIVDTDLVIQDFVNALNIRIGSKVGQPGYGTKLWDFVFEPNTLGTQQKLETEIRRVASQDPRIELNEVKAFTYDHGILIEVQMSVTPFNQPLILKVSFDSETNIASLTSQTRQE